MTDVLQLDPTRRDNARLMSDCACLGYLVDPVVDVTYNVGRFWREIDPPALRFDIDPRFDAQVADFRDLPLASGSVATVVLDPPFKLSGTSKGQGPAALDAGYGNPDSYQSITEIHTLIQDGIDEAWRILSVGGRLLLKCQAQQSCAHMNDQPGMFAERAVASGRWIDVDRLHVITKPRKQPGVQRTARSNLSTLVVLRKRRVRSLQMSIEDLT